MSYPSLLDWQAPLRGRYVVLGNGRRVRLGRYVAAWRQCLALPAETRLAVIPDGSPGSVGEALRQFRAGMHDRINQSVPGAGAGRKWSQDWQRAMIQAAGAINMPRLVIHWLPADLLVRFGDRVTRHDD